MKPSSRSRSRGSAGYRSKTNANGSDASLCVLPRLSAEHGHSGIHRLTEPDIGIPPESSASVR